LARDFFQLVNSYQMVGLCHPVSLLMSTDKFYCRATLFLAGDQVSWDFFL